MHDSGCLNQLMDGCNQFIGVMDIRRNNQMAGLPLYWCHLQSKATLRPHLLTCLEIHSQIAGLSCALVACSLNYEWGSHPQNLLQCESHFDWRLWPTIVDDAKLQTEMETTHRVASLNIRVRYSRWDRAQRFQFAKLCSPLRFKGINR